MTVGLVAQLVVQSPCKRQVVGSSPTQTSMKTLTEKQKSYIAAIIDGEGNIGLSKNSNDPRARGVIVQPRVRVTNTNIVLLTHLKQITDIGVIQTKLMDCDKRKDTFDWRIHIPDMEDLLSAIQDDLVIKWDQCCIVLEFLRHKWHSPLTDDENSLRRIMFNELAELNKRGK